MIFPRLTGNLRAFVAGIAEPQPQNEREEKRGMKELRAKRKEMGALKSDWSKWSWLKERLLEKRQGIAKKDLEERMKGLLDSIRKLLQDVFRGPPEEVAPFVLKALTESEEEEEVEEALEAERVLAVRANRLVRALIPVLGPVIPLINSDLAKHTAKCATSVLSVVPYEDRKCLFSPPSAAEDSENGWYFGKKIRFKPLSIWDPKEDIEGGRFSSSDDDDDDEAAAATKLRNRKESFTMKYVDWKDGEEGGGRKDEKGEVEEEEEGRFDYKWLKLQFRQAFYGMDGKEEEEEESEKVSTADDFCKSTYQMLCSGKTDEELQNELFDLLGFDRFELIQQVLEKREMILLAPPSQPRPSHASNWLPENSRILENKSANLGIGIRIQSETEKSIVKFIQKEEKKFQRKANEANDKEGGAEFDPLQLRAQREADLLAAMSSPLFSSKSATSAPKYPNVYDSLQDCKQAAGFISGNKLLLPANVKRENTNTYEEVTIPIDDFSSSSESIKNVPKKLVSVAEDMDELCQAAFEGTKQLNRIQSVVFRAAYDSNENLLICAPTGAGKTNVAMLCVLREIRRHLLRHSASGRPLPVVDPNDEFKMVYVAPMKALAGEMTRTFERRLSPLGIRVKEMTGDTQLTKAETRATHLLVTTPEKWDVVSRKSTGDVSLALLVRLIILDEVHLLHGDRGPVLEAIVARTLRQVETTQQMIRLVGLSATLPNYVHVAEFLHVNPYVGLFYFDARFRPVPLEMSFVGVKGLSQMQQTMEMDRVCFDNVLSMVHQGHQVMVFVHARNATVRTAQLLREMANNAGNSEAFLSQENERFHLAAKAVGRSRNAELRELFPSGFSFHHAGMLRQDRNLVERIFSEGHVKVLVCTATLAWGVNLPAHAVIIKGTELYDSKRGSFVDLGILDVMQIFGRAGRPQFDTRGSGTIITTHDKLVHYLSLLTCQYPIESQFVSSLADNLNAEIVLGSVTNVEEAMTWLRYTYLYVRMRANPLVYGVKYDDLKMDPELHGERRALIERAARELDSSHMIRFEKSTGYLHATHLGRTASHFYVKQATVQVFNGLLKPHMNEGQVIAMIAQATEFEQLKVRDDELEELDMLTREYCQLPVEGGSENTHGKVNILLQAHVSRAFLRSFSLVSDQALVTQNASRILRSLFEIVLNKGWALMSGRLLGLCKVLEHRLWGFQHPLRQFTLLSNTILDKLEQFSLDLDRIREMEASEIGHYVRHPKMGEVIERCCLEVPFVRLECSVHPITRSVLRVDLSLEPAFRWNDAVHGRTAEPFWIWMEDPSSDNVYHSEHFLLSRKQVVKREVQRIVFTIPISEPLPSQYIVRCESDRWLGTMTSCPVSFKHLILPQRHPPHTDLLDLRPLPVTSLHDPSFESLYRFSHFNPIQTQLFHVLYHTDANVLLGAPTGSGKTIAAEIAIFRVFKTQPKMKVVYIAPLKALVRERIQDWSARFEERLRRRVVELTGDVTPDAHAIAEADVIVTTPEKWDGISRSWQTRSYVRSVTLIVIDEIHLLGEERGPVLEVIVSRTNFISSHTGIPVRVIGLSTALANASDLADWLGIKEVGLYNFRPSVRPVPMQVHIQGFPGKHYCPRMATMNKPIFQAIRSHSPEKPTLVFVSSRRQTRLTALDLIAFLAAQNNPKQWLHINEQEMDVIISGVKDPNLKLILSFGMAIHHAGLQERDRKIVERLFVQGKIQVLIATATLAWGVNFPAHLVVVKGTEYFDGKTRRYVDFPITDVLQMIGRAGRPQYDDHGVAVVLVHDVKKPFYKKFLYEPFPVESSLLEVLPEHLNAEVVAGTVTSKQEAMDYLTWTYFFRRLMHNPTYYSLESQDSSHVNGFLSQITEKSIGALYEAGCVDIGEDERELLPTTLGRIASYYYLHHRTVHLFRKELSFDDSLEKLLKVLSDAHEYHQLPVRHNEDLLNADLAKLVPLAVDPHAMDDPHTKTHLLLQAHFQRAPLPCSDYATDLKSVLDQSLRILQAMMDLVAEEGWLGTALRVAHLMQQVIQGRWFTDNPFLCLPHLDRDFLLPRTQALALPQLMHEAGRDFELLKRTLAPTQQEEEEEEEMEPLLEEFQWREIHKALSRIPVLDVVLKIVRGRAMDDDEQEEEGLQRTSGGRKRSLEGGRVEPEAWIPVVENSEYLLQVDMERLNPLKKGDSKAYAPRFPKAKDEGWFLVLGDIERRELLALKRVAFVWRKGSAQLCFTTPSVSASGSSSYSRSSTRRVIYTLYVVSDTYQHIDQQYDVRLEISSRS